SSPMNVNLDLFHRCSLFITNECELRFISSLPVSRRRMKCRYYSRLSFRRTRMQNLILDERQITWGGVQTDGHYLSQSQFINQPSPPTITSIMPQRKLASLAAPLKKFILPVVSWR